MCSISIKLSGGVNKMHNIPQVKTLKANKQQARLLLKTEAELNKETEKQLDIIYHAAALVLYRNHSWNNEMINDFVSKVSQDIWSECAASNDISMVQMLWEETGIELMSEDKNQRWFEVMFLNSELDDGRGLTVFQWIAMRQNQKRWVPAQITACVLMALRRKEGWKDEALGKFFMNLEDIKADYGYDPDELRRVCFEETDFCIEDEHFMVPKKEA